MFTNKCKNVIVIVVREREESVVRTTERADGSRAAGKPPSTKPVQTPRKAAAEETEALQRQAALLTTKSFSVP